MPQAATHPCNKARCTNLTVNRFCEEHTSTTWDNYHQGKNRHERGYGNAWEKLRRKILKRDKQLCQVCIKLGLYTPAQAVDHIIPKSNNGTDQPNNLQSICNACHKVKTYSESKGSINKNT